MEAGYQAHLRKPADPVLLTGTILRLAGLPHRAAAAGERAPGCCDGIVAGLPADRSLPERPRALRARGLAMHTRVTRKLHDVTYQPVAYRLLGSRRAARGAAVPV